MQAVADDDGLLDEQIALDLARIAAGSPFLELAIPQVEHTRLHPAAVGVGC